LNWILLLSQKQKLLSRKQKISVIYKYMSIHAYQLKNFYI